MKIKRLSPSATVPTRATEGSAGYDLYADIDKVIEIPPMETVMVGCGFAFEIPPGIAGMVHARSGLSTKEGIILANSVAVIDSDFRGEVKIPLRNLSNETRIIHPQQRVAQIVFVPYYSTDMLEVDKLSDTTRGTGGFGSSGR